MVVRFRFSLALVAFYVLGVCSGESQEPTGKPAPPKHFYLTPQTPQGLQALLRYDGQRLPLVSGHRGGAGSGYPENCLATFERTVQNTFALLEVDPRFTKDGAVVLHHDPRLERTTNGTGLVNEHTLADLKQLRLKDLAGKVTEYSMPTLDEALEWARGKAVLVLDQKDVPAATRVKKVEEHQAEAFAMLIVYSFADAKACYELNPNIMLEVMVPSREKMVEFDKLGVPWKNVIAFVGHVPPRDRELYAGIHQRGALCMVGTSRNLDREVLTGKAPNIEPLKVSYEELLERGADVFETDIPAQVGPLLYRGVAAAAAKQSYFQGR